MDSLPAAASGGGIAGVILGIVFIIYKCCEKRSSRCHTACVDVSVTDGVNSAAVAPLESVVTSTNTSPVAKVV